MDPLTNEHIKAFVLVPYPNKTAALAFRSSNNGFCPPIGQTSGVFSIQKSEMVLKNRTEIALSSQQLHYQNPKKKLKKNIARRKQNFLSSTFS